VVAAAGRGGGGGIFTFKQNGNALTGTIEGADDPRAVLLAQYLGGGAETVAMLAQFLGVSEKPVGIEDGKVEGDSFSFKAGTATYTGTVKGDQIELRPGGGPGADMGPFADLIRRPAPTPVSGPQPAIGPLPNGSDPSLGAMAAGGGGGQARTMPATALRRVQR